jgi:hypothetical protein
MRAFGKADPAALSRVDADCYNAGGLLLVCCRNSKLTFDGSRNGCSPPDLLGARLCPDHLAVLNMLVGALKRRATVTSFDPPTLLPVLAMETEHLGLIATASTTFEPAYTIARRFASLDHISGCRAGWNLVTTSNPDAALNFG